MLNDAETCCSLALARYAHHVGVTNVCKQLLELAALALREMRLDLSPREVRYVSLIRES